MVDVEFVCTVDGEAVIHMFGWVLLLLQVKVKLVHADDSPSPSIVLIFTVFVPGVVYVLDIVCVEPDGSNPVAGSIWSVIPLPVQSIANFILAFGSFGSVFASGSVAVAFSVKVLFVVQEPFEVIVGAEGASPRGFITVMGQEIVWDGMVSVNGSK